LRYLAGTAGERILRPYFFHHVRVGLFTTRDVARCGSADWHSFMVHA